MTTVNNLANLELKRWVTPRSSLLEKRFFYRSDRMALVKNHLFLAVIRLTFPLNDLPSNTLVQKVATQVVICLRSYLPKGQRLDHVFHLPDPSK